MTAVDFQTYTSTNVSNPELILLDSDRHLEANRTEGATVQAIQNPENVDKKKKAKLYPTNKTAPTLSKQGDGNFNSLVKMMRAILAMQAVLSNNMGKRQTYQASIGQVMVNAAIAEQKKVAAEVKKIQHEEYEAHHRSWWQKALGWALAAVAVALAALTAGLAAALVVVAFTVLTMSGEMNKGFLGKINSTLAGKICMFIAMVAISGGIAGAAESAAAAGGAAAEVAAEDASEQAAEDAAQQGLDDAANGGSRATRAAKTAAIYAGASTAGSNGLLGTLLYDGYKACGGKASKKAEEILDIVGMILTMLAALAACKYSGIANAEATSEMAQKAQTGLNFTAILLGLSTAVFNEILPGVAGIHLYEAQKKYADNLSSFELLEALANIDNERSKEDQEDVKRQTDAFEQEIQTFSTITMPYRTIAQVLA